MSIFASSKMVLEALAAAEALAADGISAEVVDLRTLRPLDADAIVRSVAKTNRAVVVNEGWRFCGYGAELSATIMERAFDHLDAPTVRRLHRRFGHALEWFTPPGYHSWFRGRGVRRVTELDWW